MISKYDLDEIIPRITGELKAVLENELSLGNEIAEVAGGWPFSNANVWLKYCFKGKYDDYNTLKYYYLDDPKHWLEHYEDKSIQAMVAVRASAKT